MDRPLVRSTLETFRNVSLQLPVNFGPFTSLAIPGRSLETIIYLAVGLRGWWKTEETTTSLLGVIKMQHSDNEILTAPSFQRSLFDEFDNGYPLHGTTINDEENGARGLQSHQMSGPFTGPMTGSQAVICIRALTSGLLCLFSHSEVFDTLFDILQKCLIHFHQPDTQFARHGPFSSALKEWIEAQSIEESFRRKSADVMQQLDAAAKAFLSVNMEDLRGSQFFEQGLVLEFLQWLLVEEHRHDPAIAKDYPTRSLRVWSLAFVLDKMGFRVEASNTPILDHGTWEDQVSQSLDVNSLWRVHLVISNSVLADLTYTHRPSRRIDFRERRLIPIGTIPLLAFDCFRFYNSSDLDLDILNEIFLSTFDKVTEQLPKYSYLQALAGSTGISHQQQRVPQENCIVHSQMTEYQRLKLEDWVDHPGIAQLLLQPILQYIPEKCPDECGKPKCHYLVPFRDSNGNSDEAIQFSSELRKDHKSMSPWIKMHIIMLAFSYGIACQFIIADDGKRAGLNTEVSWKSIQFFENRDDWEAVRLVVPDGDLKTWVRTMSAALNFRLEPLDTIPTETWPQHRRLKKALFHMICGVRSEARGSDISDTIHEDTVGCCANGISLISKALVNPTVDASTLHLYFVRFGRILELPVNTASLIEGCNPVKRAARVSRYDPSSQPRLMDTILPYDSTLFDNVRWDAEPDWSDDFNKVALCCRLNGVPRGVYNPWYLARRSCQSVSDRERCQCKCSSITDVAKVTFPSEEYWTELPLCDFYRAGAVLTTNHRFADYIDAGKTRYIFVRAGERAHNQLAALDITTSRASNEAETVVRKILSPCLMCAAEFARKQPAHWKTLFRGRMHSKKFVNFIVLSG